MNKDGLLILCQFFYPEYVSSATLPYEMSEDFVKAGIKVDVLCGYPKEYLKDNKNIPLNENFNGINIKRVKYLQFNRKHSISRIINQMSFIISVILKFGYIIKHKCIIVYSDPPMLPIITAIANKLFKTKFIFVAYDIFPDIAIAMKVVDEKSVMTRIMDYINRIVYSRASKIIALSDEMKEYIIEKRIPVNSRTSVEVIPNWYDKNNINYGNISNNELKKLKGDGRFVVLYSGNMGTCQDMDTIIGTVIKLKENKDVFFVFTGHGNKVDMIKRAIRDNNLENAVFYDFLHGDDYSDMLQLADCHIVSLEKGVERLCVPSKTYSYLSAGRTLLAIMSENTDIAKMLSKYKAGFSFKQGDIDGLSKVIINLKNNKDENCLYGNNARKAFTDLYERHICTGKYTSIVTQLLS